MAYGSAEVPEDTNFEITYFPDRPEAFWAWAGEFMVMSNLSTIEIIELQEPKTFAFAELDANSTLDQEMQTLTNS